MVRLLVVTVGLHCSHQRIGIVGEIGVGMMSALGEEVVLPGLS
jgi:hypothetical protein